MKYLISAVILAVSTAYAQPAKHPEPNTNCVTKDKKGNCPPAPNSMKPTPKKKKQTEAK